MTVTSQPLAHSGPIGKWLWPSTMATPRARPWPLSWRIHNRGFANPLLIHGTARDGRSSTDPTPMIAKSLVRATGGHAGVLHGPPVADFGSGSCRFESCPGYRSVGGDRHRMHSVSFVVNRGSIELISIMTTASRHRARTWNTA